MAELFELKCRNCGSTDLRKENGVYVCQNCGSRFILEAVSIEETDKYRDRVIHAMTSDDEDYMTEGAEDTWEERWLYAGERRIAEQEEYTEKLLKVLPEDPYGWASRVALDIYYGFGDHGKVMKCLQDADRTIRFAEKYSDHEERNDIATFIYRHLTMYKNKFMEKLQDKADLDLYNQVVSKSEKYI